MKNCVLLAVLLLFPVVGLATHGNGNDDSDTASGTANCNASFQEDCVDEPTIHSDTVAAPVGAMGGGAIETLALIILLGSSVRICIARKRLA